MRCGILCWRWGTRSGRVQPWIIGGGGSSSPPSDTLEDGEQAGVTSVHIVGGADDHAMIVGQLQSSMTHPIGNVCVAEVNFCVGGWIDGSSLGTSSNVGSNCPYKRNRFGLLSLRVASTIVRTRPCTLHLLNRSLLSVPSSTLTIQGCSSRCSIRHHARLVSRGLQELGGRNRSGARHPRFDRTGVDLSLIHI